MFILLLILLVVGVSLGVGLLVGGLFVQGYIYTEPSRQVFWGAPVTAAVLFCFFTAWCLLVVFAQSTPSDIPYDVIQRFSAREDMTPAPAKDLWAVRKNGKTEHYVLKKSIQFAGRAGAEYRSVDSDRPWNGDGVDAVVLKNGEQELRLERVPEAERERGANREFVNADGWTMKLYDTGPTGIPSRFRYLRFIGNLFLNSLHFVLWFLCLWLLLRFQWTHAFGFALALWIAFTLIVLPMLLGQAAEVSEARRTPPRTAALGLHDGAPMLREDRNRRW